MTMVVFTYPGCPVYSITGWGPKVYRYPAIPRSGSWWKIGVIWTGGLTLGGCTGGPGCRITSSCTMALAPSGLDWRIITAPGRKAILYLNMMIWWFENIMLWFYDGLMKWWYDFMMRWWNNLLWWYDEMVDMMIRNIDYWWVVYYYKFINLS